MKQIEIKYLRDVITFGKYKGDQFKELPASYINWAVKEGIFITNNPDVQDLVDECKRRVDDYDNFVIAYRWDVDRGYGADSWV